MNPIFVSRSPYRISLLGGGSDLDWFVNQNGYGYSLGYSLNHSSTVILNPLPSTASYGILNYSTREYYSSTKEVIHPLIKAAFSKFNNLPLFELSSYGVASGGSGLGGSSSFLVALLGSLYLYNQEPITPHKIALQASNIEINDLGLPIGRQDHFTSAIGGFTCLKYLPYGLVEELILSKNHLQALYNLVDTLILIPTKISRPADRVLSKLRDDSLSVSQFSEIRSVAQFFIENESHDSNFLLSLLHDCITESWHVKRNMTGVMTTELNDLYDVISSEIPTNWIRLIGAGRGGYFLASVKIPLADARIKLDNLNILGSFPASISESGLITALF